MKRSLRNGLVGLAALASVVVPTASAGASNDPGWLCHARVGTWVYSPYTWQPKYVILAGQAMRVHKVSGGWFYGHSSFRNDDGWADGSAFDYCE